MNKIKLLTVSLMLCLMSLPVMAGGPLHEATKEGDVAKIRTLLSGVSSWVNRWFSRTLSNKDARGDDVLTPLHRAAMNGQVEAVRALLKAGADVNAQDKYEVTPLHFAAYSGHDKAVHVLLEAGANVNAKDSDGCSPSDYARIVIENTEGSAAPFEETIEVLQAAGGQPLAGCVNSVGWWDWLYKVVARWWGVNI